MIGCEDRLRNDLTYIVSSGALNSTPTNQHAENDTHFAATQNCNHAFGFIFSARRRSIAMRSAILPYILRIVEVAYCTRPGESAGDGTRLFSIFDTSRGDVTKDGERGRGLGGVKEQAARVGWREVSGWWQRRHVASRDM